MTIPKFWPKPILISETKLSKTKTEIFFRDQIFLNWYWNPPKIGKSLESETETETSEYPWQFLKRSSPNISLIFLLCFSSPPEYNVKVIVNVNVAVFAFLHLIDRNKTTTKIRIQKKRFSLLTWSSFFLVILILSFPRPSFPAIQLDHKREEQYRRVQAHTAPPLQSVPSLIELLPPYLLPRCHCHYRQYLIVSYIYENTLWDVFHGFSLLCTMHVLVRVLTSQYQILMFYYTTTGPLLPLLPSANQVGGGTFCTWWKSNDNDDNGGGGGIGGDDDDVNGADDEAMLMMMVVVVMMVVQIR